MTINYFSTMKTFSITMALRAILEKEDYFNLQYINNILHTLFGLILARIKFGARQK